MNIGLIARMDNSGLGIQTRRLARLIKPDKIMLIDSRPFNGNEQHPEWYKEHIYVNGFPSDYDVRYFLEKLSLIITCEMFYNNHFVEIARDIGVKTVNIFNYEFLDNLRHPDWALPDKLIQPSYWHLDEMKQRFGAEYLPTPIFKDEFERARAVNLKRKGKKPKYLFINGKTAIHDRNGLESLYEALQLAKGNFTVTVKAQGDVKRHPDPRLIYDFSNPEDPQDLYIGFDALIMPRRYGGQCLPMCEALQSALPVIMTNIDPNNKVLPPAWLVESEKTGEFMTRTMIDIYSADPKELAYMLDNPDVSKDTKLWALQIAEEYDADKLKPKYEELIK